MSTTCRSGPQVRPHGHGGTRRRRLCAGVATASMALAAVAAQGATVIAAPNDFLPTFAGTTSPDLDVLSLSVAFDGSTFRLDTTVNGPVGTLPTALYVFGVNRGAETANFTSLGLPGVVFDSVVLMTGAGDLSGTDLATGTPFSLPAGAATIDGNSFTIDVPLSVLPSLGLPPEQYGFNLWPRDFGGPPLSDPQIADFAPDDTVLAAGSVTPIPEPATWAQLALGFAGLAFALRRSRGRDAKGR